MDTGSNHSPNSSTIKWTKSLPVKFGLIQLFIASFIILCTFLVLLVIQQKQLLQQQNVLNKSNGQVVVAKLQEVTSQVEGLANSMANLGELYRYDNDQLLAAIPKLLSLESQKSLIAGGGLWPEPGAFDKNKHRNSLFWARNNANQLIQNNDYNTETSKGYHLESWYRPTRFYSKGRTLWSESYMDPHTKTAMVTTSVPMWMDHEFVGAATVDISLASLGEFLKQALYGTPGYVMALDPYNRLISYPDDKRLFEVNSKGEQQFINFEQFVAQYSYYLPIYQQLEAVDNQFIKHAFDQRVFTQEQIDSLQLSSDKQAMLSAIINSSANSWPRTAQHLFSNEVTQDPFLNESALVSVFLMPSTYWKIIVVTPTSTLQDQATIIAGKVGTSLLIMQVLALLLLFSIQHRLFIAPISHMVKALKYKTLSKLQLEASNRRDEIGVLAKAFIYRNEQLEIAMASVDASNLALEQQLEVQQSAQIELKLNKDKLNTLLNSSQCLIYLKDIEGRYTLVNDKFCETIGIERHRLIGSCNRELFSSEFTQILTDNEQRLLESGQALYLEEVLPTPHGEACYLVNKFVIKNRDEKPTAIGGIAINIDSKKQQEIEQAEHLRQVLSDNKHLELQTTHFQTLSEELKSEQLHLKEQLHKHEQLSFAALKNDTLVQTIMSDFMHNFMLEQDKLVANTCLIDIHHSSAEEQFDKLKEELVIQAERLRCMSALTSKDQALVKSIHADLFLTRIESALSLSLKQHRVALTTKCDTSIVLNTNTWYLFLILYRCITNALSHAFSNRVDDKQITIEVFKTQGKQVEISIQDNGIGIPFKMLNSLEEQFNQKCCNGTQTQIKFWVEEIMNGKYQLESKLGEGTKITLTFPLNM